jgi:hypothetical protein
MKALLGTAKQQHARDMFGPGGSESALCVLAPACGRTISSLLALLDGLVLTLNLGLSFCSSRLFAFCLYIPWLSGMYLI